AAYEKRFNSTLTSHGVQAYTVMHVIKDALERAGSTDRDKLRDALAKTNLADHILPQDAIKFDETGENVNASPALLQVQNGRPTLVGPARPRWRARRLRTSPSRYFPPQSGTASTAAPG